MGVADKKHDFFSAMAYDKCLIAKRAVGFLSFQLTKLISMLVGTLFSQSSETEQVMRVIVHVYVYEKTTHNHFDH